MLKLVFGIGIGSIFFIVVFSYLNIANWIIKYLKKRDLLKVK